MNIFALSFFCLSFSASYYNVNQNNAVKDPAVLKNKLDGLNITFLRNFLATWSNLVKYRLYLDILKQNFNTNNNLIKDIKTALHKFKKSDREETGSENINQASDSSDSDETDKPYQTF